MHFLACAIGVNVVGTHAWYLLHLCGGCGAHVSHLLQFFHAFTPFFFFFFFCNRPALSSDKALGFTTRSLHQCCRAQYSHPIYCVAEKANLDLCLQRIPMHGSETMMVETDDPRPASKGFSTINFMWQSKKLTNVVE